MHELVGFSCSLPGYVFWVNGQLTYLLILDRFTVQLMYVYMLVPSFSKFLLSLIGGGGGGGGGGGFMFSTHTDHCYIAPWSLLRFKGESGS